MARVPMYPIIWIDALNATMIVYTSCISYSPLYCYVLCRSAGGQIILELLGNSFPTTCLYVSDTSRCTSPR